jgi:L-aminopeptidase/D-esterase-like protein
MQLKFPAIAWAFFGAMCAAAAAPTDIPPVPHVSFDGPSLAFDFPAVKIGAAEYEEGPTGATVIVFSKKVSAAVDVRGGAPGTVNTDVLRPGGDLSVVDAITLAGGSAYGLAAATGLANALKERSADPGGFKNIAVVPGAIIFDLAGRRYNAVTPDEKLARAALDAMRGGWVPLGARGAGRFAMQGGYFGEFQHSGQGAAFRQSGEIKVLVVTVVNALGAIVDRNGQMLRCAHPTAGACGPIAERIAAHLAALAVDKNANADAGQHACLTANTTITVLVTNQSLPHSALQRLAVQVHNSMARAIQPFGTEFDGDTLFAVSTGEIKNAAMSGPDLGALASEVAWDAILASAPVLTKAAARSEVRMAAAAAELYRGRYELAPGAIAEVRPAGAGLEIEVAGRASMYLPADKWVALTPVGKDEFELATPRADRLRFDRDAAARILGLTINPGPWPIPGRRL